MKINDSQLNKIQEIYQKQINKFGNKEKNKKARSDKINISDQAQEIKKIREKLKEVDEIRDKKVKEIKNAINNDDYEVKPRHIAQKILHRVKE